MKFKSFQLKNFKGIEDINIEMSDNKEQGPKVLIGLNESGKTTILEGIALIGRHCKKIKKEKVLNGEIQDIFPRISLFTGNTELSCVIQNGKSEIKVRFVYRIEKSSFKEYQRYINDEKIAETANNEDECENEKNTYIVDIVDKIAQNIPDILYYDDFIFEIPKEVVFQSTKQKGEQEEQKFLKNKTNIEWQNIFEDVLKSSKNGSLDISFQKDIVDFLDNNPDGEMSLSQSISSLEKEINRVITKQWVSIFKSNASLKEIVIERKNYSTHQGYLIKVKAKNGDIFTLRERSKGCKWFFSFMLFTEFRKHRNPNTVFLLDEPASNMHASIQEKIIEAINNLSKSNYVIYSTHSPYLLDIGNIDNSYVVKNLNSDSEVKRPKIEIRKITEEEIDNNEQIRPMLNHIQFKLPQLFQDIDTTKTRKKSNKDTLNKTKKLSIPGKKFGKKMFEKITVSLTADGIKKIVAELFMPDNFL